ncbi:modulator of levamisole receptor-1 domain-containing protein [Ditylenchus destructor]|nr:modulator of levamisole receptor-1 domain-containing protein [Ditylenchus destructor]
MYYKVIHHFKCYNFVTIYVAIFVTWSSKVLCNNSTDLNCQIDLNTTRVVDPSGLLDECEIWQIDYDLNELELQTRVNQSHDPCERTGLRGSVVIAQRENLEEDQRLNLTTIISIIRSGAVEKINATDEIPNPLIYYKKCGLSKPGFVCDPDSLLAESQRNQTNSQLEQIRELSKM